MHNKLKRKNVKRLGRAHKEDDGYTFTHVHLRANMHMLSWENKNKFIWCTRNGEIMRVHVYV